MQLTIDRKSFIEVLAEGQGDVSGAMPPPPGGLRGLPPEILQTLPGYGPDVQANRAEARKLMENHGYGPDNRLPVKVATRNIGQYRLGTCHYPRVHGVTVMVNSIFNGWRFEDAWLDQ